MKHLLQQPDTHKVVLLVALAIVLGMTVDKVFFVVAQVLALAALVYVVVGAIRDRKGRTIPAHRRS